MKWQFINNAPKRIGLALIIGATIHLVVASLEDVFVFDFFDIIIYAALSYIVLTLINAVVTTFFSDEENES